MFDLVSMKQKVLTKHLQIDSEEISQEITKIKQELFSLTDTEMLLNRFRANFVQLKKQMFKIDRLFEDANLSK